jgi:hypothetical protein
MVARVGLYKSWVTWKTLEKSYYEYERNQRDSVSNLLERYAVNGELIKPNLDPDLVIDPMWSSNFLVSSLSIYGILLSRCAQISARRGEKWLEDFAAGNVALRIKFMVNLFTHERFPRRFEGRHLAQMTVQGVEVMALAFILGNKAEGVRVGKLLVEAYRRGYFFDKNHYPIFHFMLNLFCDWSGEVAPAWGERFVQNKVMTSLFERWKCPDVDELAEYVLAACDFHTHRCRADSSKEFYEFSNGAWVRYPIEILMLYRLREWSGLDNPKVDHPLMEGVLGELPPPTPLNPDELTAAVLKRMQSQGYDEDAIYRSLCG